MSEMRRWGLGAALVAVSIMVTTGPVSGDANEAPVGNIPATALTAGEEHVCVVLLGGDVACWGGGSSGRLGNGARISIGSRPEDMGANLRTVDLGTGRTVIAVVAGGEHSCALLDNATVKCWGYGWFGALGLEDKEDRGHVGGQLGNNLPAVDLGTGRTARAITAGDHHTCAILDDGTVKCWGEYADGRLGLGHEIQDQIGDDPGEMGDDLPTVDLGTGRTATAITAGYQHTCAILDNGTVKCWGYNFHGQLGLGDTASRGGGIDQMGNNLPAVDLGTGRTATAITASYQHTCAILDNGTVKCWGYNFSGQLGLGDTARRGDAANEMGDDLPAVDLGTGRTATAITTTEDHTCALLDNGTVKCWGYNSNGQLGLGDDEDRGHVGGQMGNNLPAVDLGTGRTATAVTTGERHTCALLDDATVKCWGAGDVGQLGQGTFVAEGLGDEADEMGDDLPPIDLTRSVGRPALTLDLTANRARVVATTPLVYTVTVRNTGSIPLTDIAITTPDTTPATTTCTRTVPFLAPQTTTTYTCRHTTTSANTPQITHQLLATAAQGPVALSPRTRTRVDARIVRADGLIRPGKTAFVGDNTYNSTGAAQTATAATATRAVRYTWRIQNDGNTVDRFVLRGAKGARAFTVTYRRGRADITAAVRAGAYTTPRLAPGKRTDITVTVAPTKRARTGDALSLGLTARSAASSSATDTVRATTTRR